MVNNLVWTEKKEIEVITHMASKEPRGDFEISVEDKIARLETWLKTAKLREWPDGFKTQKCIDHAHRLLKKLEDGIL